MKEARELGLGRGTAARRNGSLLRYHESISAGFLPPTHLLRTPTLILNMHNPCAMPSMRPPVWSPPCWVLLHACQVRTGRHKGDTAHFVVILLQFMLLLVSEIWWNTSAPPTPKVFPSPPRAAPQPTSLWLLSDVPSRTASRCDSHIRDVLPTPVEAQHRSPLAR